MIIVHWDKEQTNMWQIVVLTKKLQVKRDYEEEVQSTSLLEILGQSLTNKKA